MRAMMGIYNVKCRKHVGFCEFALIPVVEERAEAYCVNSTFYLVLYVQKVRPSRLLF